MAPIGSMLWRGLRVYHIYGANTDVGKTVLTTILCKTARNLYEEEKVSYLKPVSTGPRYNADARWSIHKHASDKAASSPGWLFIETAGGVHSPAPTGTPQADLYMPLRCPVILIGDSKLGGISLTISAFESLRLRGYDVEMILMFQDREYGNDQYLSEYFSGEHGRVPVVALAEPPHMKRASHQAESQLMSLYYNSASSSDAAQWTLDHLEQKHDARIARLESMAAEAHKKIWYPFTQQKLLRPDTITTIDSARGDFFQTLVPQTQEDGAAAGDCLLQPSFDGSASWWTQGLGHSNPSLTLSAAYAAGRYGHVMFAEAIHEPALALAEALLEGMQNPRLSRVFFSDNGSTGVEVALKMALRAARVRYGWAADSPIGVIGLKGGYHGDTMGAMDCAEPSVFNEKVEWYDGKGIWFDYPTVKCVRGRWVVEVPEAMREEVCLGSSQEFETLSDVFNNTQREAQHTAEHYERYIEKELKRHVNQGRDFGALLMEPVVVGAGGMLLVDPLFQRALVDIVRRSGELFSRGLEDGRPGDDDNGDATTTWTGLPVVFDEVFTGLYRLGRFTASSFLSTDADISVHAKLLTGGVVPLCATLASESVFRAFASDDKTDALLHGHSYTAHAVGCQVAVESLRQLQAMDKSGQWDWAKESRDVSIAQRLPQNGVDRDSRRNEMPWSIWSAGFVDWVSRQTSVAGVWALGSVLSIHMDGGDDDIGYKSTAAAHIRNGLWYVPRNGHQRAWNVHSRVLGNVLYIMGSQKSTQEDIVEIERLIREEMTSWSS